MSYFDDFKDKLSEYGDRLSDKHREYREEGKYERIAGYVGTGAGVLAGSPAIMGASLAALEANRIASADERTRKALQGSFSTAVQNPAEITDSIGVSTGFGLSPRLTGYVPVFIIAGIIFYIIFKG